MILTNLKGGLGNQMFQYATGFSLTTQNKTDHTLDTSGYSDERVINSDIPRTYDLDQFQISAKTATPEQIKKTKYPYGFISKIQRVIDKKVLKKHYQDYHPELLENISKKLSENPDQNIYLNGFFQSEKNFSEIRPTLLQEFQLKPEFITEQVKDFQEQIQGLDSEKNSVSIHIRRGDYSSNPKAKAHHGLCPLSYYRDAIDLILEVTEQPHFFIFTDDPDWVKENLKISSSNTFVSGHGLPPQQELLLMSRCSHNIIANSSFSWWGAWLNQNSNKIVIAPEKWTVKNTEHPNIIPEGWIKI